MVLPPRQYHSHELFSTQASAKYYAREFGQLPPCSLPKRSWTVTGSDFGYSSKGSSVLSQHQLAMVLPPRQYNHKHEFKPFNTQGYYDTNACKFEQPARRSLPKCSTRSGTDSGYSSVASSSTTGKLTYSPPQSRLLSDKLSNLQTESSRDKPTQNNNSSDFTGSHRFCSSHSDNREHDDYHVKVAKVMNGTTDASDEGIKDQDKMQIQGVKLI